MPDGALHADAGAILLTPFVILILAAAAGQGAAI
jgi:hypothetical protein